MLYDPRPHTRAANGLRLLLSAVAEALASIFSPRRDQAFFDGMRRSELEELGLRRADDGSYFRFGDDPRGTN